MEDLRARDSEKVRDLFDEVAERTERDLHDKRALFGELAATGERTLDKLTALVERIEAKTLT